VVDGLPLGAERGRTLGGRGGVLQHGGRQARLLGVVGEPRRLVGGHRREVGEDLAVQLDAPGGGDGPLHRQARQLVAKADRAPLVAQHPRPQALVDRGRVGGGDRFQQRQLDAVGDDRRGVQRAAGRRRQPGGAGEHGVADGRRDLPARGAEHLGDEERVAAGGPVTSTMQPCPPVAASSQPSSDDRNAPRSSSSMAGWYVDLRHAGLGRDPLRGGARWSNGCWDGPARSCRCCASAP